MKIDYNTIPKKDILSKIVYLKKIDKDTYRVRYNHGGVDYIKSSYAKELLSQGIANG